jgi:hypothetical protein
MKKYIWLLGLIVLIFNCHKHDVRITDFTVTDSVQFISEDLYRHTPICRGYVQNTKNQHAYVVVGVTFQNSPYNYYSIEFGILANSTSEFEIWGLSEDKVTPETIYFGVYKIWISKNIYN